VGGESTANKVQPLHWEGWRASVSPGAKQEVEKLQRLDEGYGRCCSQLKKNSRKYIWSEEMRKGGEWGIE